MHRPTPPAHHRATASPQDAAADDELLGDPKTGGALSTAALPVALAARLPTDPPSPTPAPLRGGAFDERAPVVQALETAAFDDQITGANAGGDDDDGACVRIRI